MSRYAATILWQRDGAPFTDNRYSRAHRWRFDGGLDVPASSSPNVVPLPLSDAGAVDPEEAFVAALSSCHMLWFLSIAAAAGFVVDAYEDNATGTLARNAARRLVMTEIVLHPRVAFAGGPRPSGEEFATLHRRAHDECYLANSVTTDVRCEPEML
jgi:organic hydroperoxide reductase OsmC/OhrA